MSEGNKISGPNPEKSRSDTANSGSTNGVFYCSICNNPVRGKSNFICGTCRMRYHRLFDQTRISIRRLKDKLKEAESQNQAFRQQINDSRSKQQERIKELQDKFADDYASRENLLEKLYYLASKAYLEPFGITSLYYIVDRRNLPSILERGILSKNRVVANGISHQSFAADDIQEIRARIPLTLGSGHDYVPLYFAPKPPMIYRLQKEYQQKSNQNELVYICVRREILFEQNVCFTDRNLASANCQLFQNVEGLAYLKWDIIQNPDWFADEEKKHIRGAEVLVHNCVSPAWFRKIVVYDEKARSEVYSSSKTKLPVEVRRNEFYF
jgi:hypothetical protein